MARLASVAFVAVVASVGEQQPEPAQHPRLRRRSRDVLRPHVAMPAARVACDGCQYRSPATVNGFLTMTRTTGREARSGG